jgi:hypothetical protein
MANGGFLILTRASAGVTISSIELTRCIRLTTAKIGYQYASDCQQCGLTTNADGALCLLRRWSSPITTHMTPSALKAIALWTPIEWKHNFWTIPALKQGAPAMLIGRFDQDLAEALAEMERFCRPDQALGDHAFFGPMSHQDWMRWGYLHTDHHLRQFGR